MAEHTRKISAGSLKLDELLKEHGARKTLAEKMSRGQELVSRWASGWRTPTPPDRAVLEELLQIPWQSWDDLKEAPAEAATAFHDSPAATGTEGAN